MSYVGIDVSHNNGHIDWKKVANAGVDFAIIRAGYGWNEKQIDKKFVYNITNALRYGIDCGAYWFSYAIDVETAKIEANIFLKTIRPYTLTYPIAFDFEYDSVTYANKIFKQKNIKNSNGQIKTMTPELASSIAEAFLSTCAKAGYYVVNYTNDDFINRYFKAASLSKFERWIARWTSIKPQNVTGLWQNEVRGSSSDVRKELASVIGSLSGVKGAIDMNISYKDYPTIIKDAGLNRLPKTSFPSKPQTVSYKEGDKVKVLRNLIYGTNKTFMKIYSIYDVLFDQKGDRVVIGKSGKITAAISADNLQKVCL